MKYKFFKDTQAVNAGDQPEDNQRLGFDQEKYKRRMDAMSIAEKLERISKMKAQGMDTSAAEQDLNKSKGYGNGGNVTRDPFSLPEVTEQDMIDAELAQVNDEAKSPYQQTKPELVQDVVQQEAQRTPAGQAMEGQDDTLSKLKANIEAYQSKINAPEKEYGVMDALPDILTGMYNIGARAKGNVLPDMKMPNTIQNKKAQDLLKRKESSEGLKNLQDMYTKYMEAQNELKSAKAARLEKEASEKQPTWKEKELFKSNLKQNEEMTTSEKKDKDILTKSLDTIDEQMVLIEKAYNAVTDLEKDSMFISTGPISGRLPAFTEKAQLAEQALNEISLKNMTKMFEGMSKAVDSDSERRFFQDSQAAMTKNPEVNRKILKKAMEYLQKNKQKAQERLGLISDNKKSEVKPLQHKQSSQAEEWAKKNPDDPRAKRILNVLGK